jgi:hypothetical protein
MEDDGDSTTAGVSTAAAAPSFDAGYSWCKPYLATRLLLRLLLGGAGDGERRPLLRCLGVRKSFQGMVMAI